MSGEISLREVKSLRDEICYAGERLVGFNFILRDNRRISSVSTRISSRAKRTIQRKSASENSEVLLIFVS